MVGSRWTRCTFVALVVLALPAAAKERAPTTADFDEALFHGMAWREVGPYRGGRAAAVTGVPSQPDVYYFGGTGGGVWKTIDGGVTWKNVSDGSFGGSIGAIAVSEWDPNVVYVGGGEVTVRGNVSHGDGVWKSTDAGKTWRHVGLADSRHIPRLRIHPRDPDLVYAAVLGHLFGPNRERGVYRSRDGGATWEQVLYVDENVGAVDLALDPTNPRILYASTWRVRRTPWSLESGGPGSGLWKSSDGGDTWQDLSRQEGLPEAPLGIIGVAVSAARPENVYAIVEAEDGGVFRSRDGGETWTRTSEDRNLRQRAWYYTRIVVDPADEDVVYVLNVEFWRSKDGGKSFTAIDTPHGDNHDLWIAPGDPLRMIEANDGGANVSVDGGASWTRQDNQPTAQFYRVSTDDDFPFRLLGGQQDNSAVRIRHRSTGLGIGPRDWEPTAGGESGHIAAQPGEPDVVYGGSYGGFLMRYDHATEELQAVNVWPDDPMGHGAEDSRYRFQWNFPIFFSPHDPATLYAAGNALFRSTDGATSWQPLGGDLTRDDKTKMGPSGGPITKDNTSVEYYGTIFAAAESPLQKGVLWTGSDDGLIHLSRDGGTSWENVTPAGMPEWILVNSIEPHPTEPGGLYVAATMYKWDDFRPYLVRTTDWGESWTEITDGIAADHFTRAIRADPVRPGLLYAGTERGVYVSFDDGGRWQSLQLELPIVPITDLAVEEGHLAAATQGRGFWMLDDLAPLRQLAPEVAGRDVHLFRPSPAWRIDGSNPEEPIGRGVNPPNGTIIDFTLRDPAQGTEVALEFLESDGDLIRRFEGKVELEEAEEEGEQEEREEEDQVGEEQEEEEEGEEEQEEEEEEEKKDPAIGELTAKQGHNRFAWDLRYAPAKEFEGLILWGEGGEGPRVVPGRYQVKLILGEGALLESFEVVADPRSSATQDDVEAQLAFLLAARDRLTAVHTGIERIRDVRSQLEGLRERLPEGEGTAAIRESAGALDEAMTAIEETLYQTKSKSPQDPLNFPIRLNDKLSSLAGLVALGDAAPTAQALAVGAELSAAIDGELAKLERLWAEDLPALNAQVAAAQVPAIAIEQEE